MGYRWLWVVSVLLVSLAFSGECTLQGTAGEGVAKARDGQPGEFKFGVKKWTMGDRSFLRGEFAFRTVFERERVAIAIRMPRAQELGVREHAARFSGGARLVVRDSHGERHFEGVLHVEVVDRRRDGQGDPDLLALRFVPREGNRVFEFAGQVTRGDLRVFQEHAECRVEGAKGRGVAQASNRQLAEFEFGVAKWTFGEHTFLEGGFAFRTALEQGRVRIAIEMPRVNELGVRERTARFSGKALLIARSSHGEQRVWGTLTVEVVDRRRDGQGDPDLLALRFVPREGNRVFEFAGQVVRGDIRVFLEE